MAKRKLQCRIRYEENWNERGEYFIFENKWTDEDSWGLDSAFPLLDYRGEDGTVLEQDKGAVLHYTALTKIRELQNMGIEFYFK